MASPAGSPDSSLEGPAAPGGSPSPDGDNLSPDELRLLAKLEEQNRLLEADSKSMRSVNGSRRNSGSSLVSSSSASSNLSHLEEDTWILWGRIVNEWDDWRKKKEKLLKELIRKGIPHHFRAIVWQLLCSAAELPLKAQYSELLRMSSPCERLIRRDIARTYPEHDFFKGQDSLGQEVLFNVMKAYSLVDREVGYCQGSAFIVGLLLMQMPEEEAFSVFVRLMQEYRLRELFKPSMAQLGLCIYQFEFLLQEQLPELNVHFRSQSFLTSMYASSWFLTLFLTTFPLPVATRVFDIFMYEVPESARCHPNLPLSPKIHPLSPKIRPLSPKIRPLSPQPPAVTQNPPAVTPKSTRCHPKIHPLSPEPPAVTQNTPAVTPKSARCHP
ncbi:EVI5-like protein, partial [Chamaea fasciata]|uniref:EVI5-like protein n=1 Tax=Chamaea fasciata TaxID=190680 RepID=UPI003369EC47